MPAVQQSLLQAPAAKPIARHDPLPEQEGQCGTKVLLASRSDPSKRRWQCTSGQRELFRDPQASQLMDELHRGGSRHVTRKRMEHPGIQKLKDEGLISVETNPKHFFHEFHVKLTRDGREWLNMKHGQQDQRARQAQGALFKGVRLVITARSLRKAQADAPGYGPARGATSCSTCSWYSGGNCRRYDFRARADYTCDSWDTGESDLSVRAPGGHGGQAVSKLEKVGGTASQQPDRIMQLCDCDEEPLGKAIPVGALGDRGELELQLGSAPHPIVEAEEVINAPPPKRWAWGPWRCAYTQGSFLGCLTVDHDMLPAPFQVLVTNHADAHQRAPTICASLEQGITPDRGLYLVPGLKRRKRGGQGGVAV